MLPAPMLPAEIVPVSWAAFRPVSPPPLPVNVPINTLPWLVASTTPANVFVPVKIFVALSRGRFADTTVAPWVPVTSPDSGPEKFVAVEAVAALPLMLMPAVPALKFAGFKFVRLEPLPVKVPLKATPVSLFVNISTGSCASGTVPLDRLLALRLVKPAPLPVKVPVNALPWLVASTTPANVFVPVKIFVPLRRGMFADTTVAPCVPVTSPDSGPEKFVAAEAVAALPLMLMPAVPALKFAGFKFVRLNPLPVNVPLKATPVSLFVNTSTGSCASERVPLERLLALRLVKPAPLPVKVPVSALPWLVASTTPANVFVPVKTFVPVSLGMFADTTVAPCVPVTSPDSAPEKLVAAEAVAALPLMLMPAVPTLKFAGFKFVRLNPLPVKVPLKATPVSLFVNTSTGSCASGRVPAKLVAVRLVRPAPLPVNMPLKILFPLVASTTPLKLFVPIKVLVPLSRVMFVESCVSARLPVTFVAVVAVAALPARVAVMVPAEKFPLPSRVTKVPGMFTFVAALAALSRLIEIPHCDLNASKQSVFSVASVG